MKVADLYLACVLLFAAGAVGWTLHEMREKDNHRYERLERRMKLQSATSLPQLSAALRTDPDLYEACRILMQRMRSEEVANA